jgi:hypothetical protein
VRYSTGAKFNMSKRYDCVIVRIICILYSIVTSYCFADEPCQSRARLHRQWRLHNVTRQMLYNKELRLFEAEQLERCLVRLVPQRRTLRSVSLLTWHKEQLEDYLACHAQIQGIKVLGPTELASKVSGGKAAGTIAKVKRQLLVLQDELSQHAEVAEKLLQEAELTRLHRVTILKRFAVKLRQDQSGAFSQGLMRFLAEIEKNDKTIECLQNNQQCLSKNSKFSPQSVWEGVKSIFLGSYEDRIEWLHTRNQSLINCVEDEINSTSLGTVNSADTILNRDAKDALCNAATHWIEQKISALQAREQREQEVLQKDIDVLVERRNVLCAQEEDVEKLQRKDEDIVKRDISQNIKNQIMRTEQILGLLRDLKKERAQRIAQRNEGYFKELRQMVATVNCL